MSLVFSCLCPHPPVAITEIGGERIVDVQKTTSSLVRLAAELRDAQPEVLVTVSPHGAVLPQNISIRRPADGIQRGSMEMFGFPNISMSANIDLSLVEQIANATNIEVLDKDTLDHGIFVPLYYLAKDLGDFQLVAINPSFADGPTHFAFGKALRNVLDSYGKRVAFIASGDLSHRLTQNAPSGFSPMGKEFDKLIRKSLEKAEYEKIVDMDPQILAEAGECGHRSVCMLCGLQREKLKFNTYSYEAPFGVGYLTGRF